MMVNLAKWTLGILIGHHEVTAHASFSPIQPPSYPLAVRNPYLSVWLPGSQAETISAAQPEFWFGNKVSWTVLARIDGHTYSLLGAKTKKSNFRSATLINANYTSTHSIFEVRAATETFTLDFFSPVSFDDYVRQSLPFSCLTISAIGKAESLQLYTGIGEDWTGQPKAAECSHYQFGNTSIHDISANGATFQESDDEMALWGRVVYAAEQRTAGMLSFGSGPATTLQKQFQSNGVLNGGSDSCYENGFRGFAYQLGPTLSQGITVRLAVGVVREEAIDYLGSAETHYYRSAYPDIASVVEHFFGDYESALSEACDLDSTIDTTAKELAGSNYSDILALSTRQVFGAIDLTNPADTRNISQAKAFIKEISSDGNLNTVDIIYPLFPIFYVFCPQWIKLLLDPVLQYSKAGRYPHPWAIHDLGASYPIASGHDDGIDEQMPIEETGNMILMIKAYEQATGDTSWSSEYGELLEQWATYISDYGLYPEWQLSTTDGLGGYANMTSLAVKAAVALSAYGSITKRQTWTDLGSSFAHKIVDGLGVETDARSHQPYFDLTYGDGIFYLTFNIFPSALFNLSTFDPRVYVEQSQFYPTVRRSSGVPIDGDALWGKTDWDFWMAAVSEDSTRDMFIDDTHAYLANRKNTQPFSDRYWVEGFEEGLAVFRARPTVGAHWAIWALKKGPNSGNLTRGSRWQEIW
ncbi:hypothetical protein AAFC00_005845 [Neodothiora populina]